MRMIAFLMLITISSFVLQKEDALSVPATGLVTGFPSPYEDTRLRFNVNEGAASFLELEAGGRQTIVPACVRKNMLRQVDVKDIHVFVAHQHDKKKAPHYVRVEIFQPEHGVDGLYFSTTFVFDLKTAELLELASTSNRIHPGGRKARFALPLAQPDCDLTRLKARARPNNSFKPSPHQGGA